MCKVKLSCTVPMYIRSIQYLLPTVLVSLLYITTPIPYLKSIHIFILVIIMNYVHNYHEYIRSAI